MTSIYYKYRIYCETDQKYEFIILHKDDPFPDKCPTNTAHTINTNSIAIVDTISDNEVVIKEENGKTGGSFGTISTTINAVQNTTTSISLSFPYPISAMAIFYVASAENKGDLLTLSVGENTPIGVLTAPIAPASAWASQNYIVGNMVTYTHPIFGLRTYTCIANTISNEIPTNVAFWRHGFALSVSPTVLDNTSTGYYIKISNGTNTDNMNRVVSIDKINSKIYVETNCTNSFSAMSYVLQSVFLLKDFAIGNSGNYDIGTSKIGGSFVPADTIVKIYYNNLSTTTDKFFNGRLEYLY